MWVLIGLLGLAAALLLILAVPLEFTFSYRSRGDPHAVFRLTWLFGLVKAQLTKRKPSPRQIPAEEATPEKPDGRRPDTGLLLSIMRVKGIVAHLKRFLVNTLTSLKIKRLAAELFISLDSPADTGTLFAFSAPFNYFTYNYSPWNITITPRFYDDAYFEAEIDGQVRVIPLTLTRHLVCFLFAVPSLRVAVIFLKKWKKEK